MKISSLTLLRKKLVMRLEDINYFVPYRDSRHGFPNKKGKRSGSPKLSKPECLVVFKDGTRKMFDESFDKLRRSLYTSIDSSGKECK